VDATVTTAMIAGGASLIPAGAVLLSQRMSLKAQGELKREELAEKRADRDHEFAEQRRARVHQDRAQAHAALIEVCDELRDLGTRHQSGSEDIFGAPIETLLDRARTQAGIVSVYSSPDVSRLAMELVWHCYEYPWARVNGVTRVGDPEDGEYIDRGEAWQRAKDSRTAYIAALQAELGIVATTHHEPSGVDPKGAAVTD
jgi:hypothetical protein